MKFGDALIVVAVLGSVCVVVLAMIHISRPQSMERPVCHLVHDWTKWSQPVIDNKLYDGRKIGEVLHQRRDCQRCGKTQVRNVGS